MQDVSIGIATEASFIGIHPCRCCHQIEYKEWSGSHHADTTCMLGRFGNSKYRYGKVTTTFFSHEGKFYVNIDDSDAKLADFEIQYTFSLTPLK